MKTPGTGNFKTPGTVVFVTRAGAKNPPNSESKKKIPMPGVLPPTVPGVVDAPVPGGAKIPPVPGALTTPGTVGVKHPAWEKKHPARKRPAGCQGKARGHPAWEKHHPARVMFFLASHAGCFYLPRRVVYSLVMIVKLYSSIFSSFILHYLLS